MRSVRQTETDYYYYYHYYYYYYHYYYYYYIGLTRQRTYKKYFVFLALKWIWTFDPQIQCRAAYMQDTKRERGCASQDFPAHGTLIRGTVSSEVAFVVCSCMQFGHRWRTMPRVLLMLAMATEMRNCRCVRDQYILIRVFSDSGSRVECDFSERKPRHVDLIPYGHIWDEMSVWTLCQTSSKTQTDERTNRQTDNWTNGQRVKKRADARNRIWCILALKCDIWWQYFNDFPGNQKSKVQLFYSAPESWPESWPT